MSRTHTLAMTLAVALALPSVVQALNYTGSLGNPATFETLEEVRDNRLKAMTALPGNIGRAFKPLPVLVHYPKNTTFVYRSPNL
jgi:hypothetical protein